jgi:phosphoribosylanthranilate isomerase
MFVKICGMTDEAAVEASVAAGADAVGFVFFHKSPRNLTPAAAATLASGLPDTVRKVAVMLHPDGTLWEEVQRALRPDILQTDLADFACLEVDPAIEKWPVLREGSLPGELPDTFVYEGRMSGKGQAVDWEVAADIAKRGRMILAGGLNALNVSDAIARVRPWGVDVSSAVESAPGIKDAGRISEFVAAAKAVTRE